MPKQKLKRALSAPVLTLYGLGNILGAGIYVLVGKVAGEAGMSSPLAFIIAMVVAALTAFSYMELSSRIPKSAGSAVYVFEAFKVKFLSIAIGFSMIAAGIASAAALSQGFAGYLAEILSIPIGLGSVIALVVLTAIVLAGIGQSARLAVIFTVIEAAGLLAIIWFGRQNLGGTTVSETVQLDAGVGISGLLSGAFLAFYAFIGFEDMVNVAEEVKNPRRSMPIAILGSLVLAAVFYILVVMVSVAAVSPAELSSSDAPLSLVLSRISSINPSAMSFIGMAATLNGVIVQLIMGSRMLYGLSASGWIHKRFASVDSGRQTPVFATLVVSGAMIAGTVLLPLVSLAQITSYLVLGIFALVNVSLIVLKLRRAKPRGAVEVPLILPLLGAISALAVILYQILS